jgi:stage V sporulation protein SpoVS
VSELGEILARHVASGAVPGAVALVTRGDGRIEVEAVGFADLEAHTPMVRE